MFVCPVSIELFQAGGLALMVVVVAMRIMGKAESLIDKILLMSGLSIAWCFFLLLDSKPELLTVYEYEVRLIYNAVAAGVLCFEGRKSIS